MTAQVVSIDSLRSAQLAKLELDDLQHADKTALLRLQNGLGLGNDWGVMVMPEDWMPKGGHKFPSMRRVDLATPLRQASLTSDEVEFGLLTLTRFALVYFLKPQPVRSGVVLPSPVTWRFNLRAIASVAAKALSSAPHGSNDVFGRITLRELKGLPLVYRPTAVSNLLEKLRGLKVWTDTLGHDTRPDGLEPSRKRNATPVEGVGNEPGFSPLSDETVAQLGWRVAWLIENVGMTLVACLTAMAIAVNSTPVSEGKTNTRGKKGKKGISARNNALRKVVTEWKWQTPNGQPIAELPFDLLILGRGNTKSKNPKHQWPPRNPVQVLELAKLLQTANLFVFLLCTGGRISEALSLTLDCIRQGNSDYVTVVGRTFKLVFRNDGAEQDWPVPKLGADALEIQKLLAVALTGLGRVSLPGAEHAAIDLDSIWTRVGSKGKPITGDYNYHLVKLVHALGLEHLFDDTKLHAHRFRKTIARLIALAVVGAPKVLMDLFGHQTIEMTLHYILRDPAIKSELAEIAKAQVIMFAADAISTAETNGGPIAAVIREVVSEERIRLGSELGDKDIYRLAETLTLGGKTWQLVRPGVICTKGPQQAGACNRHVGHPEPAKCRSYCSHRLETALLHDDVDRILDESVRHLQRARLEDNTIMAEYWQGQILANVRRFDDLLEKWSLHSEVAALLARERMSEVIK